MMRVRYSEMNIEASVTPDNADPEVQFADDAEFDTLYADPEVSFKLKMAHGYWMSGTGHYICIWKYDGDYIYANDPASSKRTKQKISDFMKQRKCFFCFRRE